MRFEEFRTALLKPHKIEERAAKLAEVDEAFAPYDGEVKNCPKYSLLHKLNFTRTN